MEIMLLYGGEGAEREVSLCSGVCVAQVLRERGHRVLLQDLTCLQELDTLLDACRRADAVFLALHGGFGEDGRLQERLEQAGVFWYTGSAPAASALAMQKSNAKQAVTAVGVPVPRGCVFRGQVPGDWQPPYIVKPESGGSSVGFRVIREGEQGIKTDPSADYLCEEYLPGREFSVGVLSGHALPPIQLCPVGGVYDYAHKYTPNATKELCPAPISAAYRARLQNYALASFSALGLRDYARIDFKENASGVPCFLEANTLPGMTKTSLLPLAASAVHMEMGALCEQMASLAGARKP